MSVIILGIESSCDDTSAAVIVDGELRSNVIANQVVHEKYGGVVPELASRAHQQNIVPVVEMAIREANISRKDISAVGFTRGPGLMGALLVGTSFAKGVSMSLKIPLIEVNHLHAHIIVNFIKEPGVNSKELEFPFITLLVSGGHTQIIHVKGFTEMEIIGQTLDDAAGEAFDKCAKLMGLPYPGGPWIDKYAKEGNESAFKFPHPVVNGLDYSFSGLKTSFLYFLRDREKDNPGFAKKHLNDLCASLQRTIIDILVNNLVRAVELTGIKRVVLAGGVAANSGLRNFVSETGDKMGWDVFIPKPAFTTDNAAMIAITAYFKYLKKEFSSNDVVPEARFSFRS